jgi:MoaA/NifB/PqqE/SkfB family radical SAM enzyme
MPRILAKQREENFTLRRLARRVGRGPAPSRVEPLERPIGAKLEITYACNLRCDFCYTDSPRRTLERSIDMDDDAWRAVVADVIDLGILEAVVTGGEPFLRAALTLELLETLDAAGVAVSLNTNGWFVDAAVADRLSRLENLTVHISLDGPTAEMHDAARGVPGSWRRAVRAIDLLLARGVTVTVNHVVTPLNEHALEQVIDMTWRLGVGLMRVTPVVPIGAASRVKGWGVDRQDLRRLVDRVQADAQEDFEVILQSGAADQVAYHDERAPGAFLVRPDGAVKIDSINPFAFGRVEEGLARCWKRITEEWRNREVTGWADSIGSARELASADVVAYADDEVQAGAPAKRREKPRPAPRLPRRSARSTERVELGDLDDARNQVTALALARGYRVARLRSAGNLEAERVVRIVSSGRVCRLSASAGVLLDHLDGATAAQAAAALAAHHPDVERDRIERDTIRTVRWLLHRGVIAPGDAEAGSRPEAALAAQA